MEEERQDALVFRLNDHGQGPDMIRQVFLERGWMEFNEDSQEESDWNLWWRTSRFRNSDYEQLASWQRLNHYPKSTAITRKDSLARNMKRMRGVYGPNVFNFSPVAFNLPNDYTRYVAEYTKEKEKNAGKPSLWICKPADMSRGRGIFIYKELSELQYDCNAVVQKYIINPMLISGYKFDLRIYVMVPSFHPLSIYIYQEGLVRFGTEKYDLSNLANLYSHLTNTSINKHSPTYKMDKERVGPGCKWTLTQLRQYFHSSNINDELLFKRIMYIVILTLIVQAKQVPASHNCFELYGFDIIIDENVKPWLLEVNFSPALSADCHTDVAVKKPMLHDLITLLNFQPKDLSRGGKPPRQQRVDRVPGLVSPSPSQKPARYHHSVRVQSSQNNMGNKLPNIAGTSRSLSNPSAARTPNLYLEEEGDEDQWVAPIIPGCGLPSVQQPPESRPSSSSSGCSSQGSTHSVESLDDQEWHRSTRRLQHHQARPGLQSHRNSAPWKRSFGSANRHDGSKPERRYGRLPHQEPKVLVTSDSAISSNSGSSENSDHTERARKKWTAYKSKDDIHSHLTKSQHDLLVGREKGFVNRPYQAFAPLREKNEDFDSDYVQPEIRKKPFQVSFTANPLVSKSLLRRRGTLRSSQKLSSRGYKSRTNPAPNMFGRQVQNRGPSQKEGDFYLVFPFNDITKKCLKDLDSRVIIRECQKLVRGGSTESLSNPREGGQKREAGPPIWGSLKLPPGTADFPS